MTQCRLRFLGLIVSFVMAFAGLFCVPIHVKAACAAGPNGTGSVTGSFSIPVSSTYTVWSRMMPDSANQSFDSYILEIDGNYCNIVVGNSSLYPSVWNWVDFRDGNPYSPIRVTLAAGTHTYKMYGNESNVSVDKIIFAADATCYPVDTGENCAGLPPDSDPPSVSLTSPTNGQTVSGTITVSAAASDNVGISSVDFYLDGVTWLATDTTAPYSMSFSTATATNGTHTLTAEAMDTSGLVTRSSNISVIINNTVTDTSPPTISLSGLSTGQTVSGTVLVTANATDNVGIAKVELVLDGTVVATDQSAPYTFSWNTSGVANGPHSVQLNAFDVAGNRSTSTSINVNVSNAVPSVKPGDANLSGTVDVFDMSIVLANWGKTSATWAMGDVSKDGTVNVFDLSIVLNNWGK